jgi:hypothetical protein
MKPPPFEIDSTGFWVPYNIVIDKGQTFEAVFGAIGRGGCNFDRNRDSG